MDIVIPTVKGREDSLERCITSYEDNSEVKLNFIVIHDRDTCGEAWIDGANLGTSRFIHFTADDVEAYPGWDVAALGTINEGYLPAPVLRRSRVN